MSRIIRIVAPGYPHHIPQRGNRRQQTFFSDEDYQSYIDLMAEWCKYFNVEIWSYCLMPNHTYLIAVPATSDGLAFAIGEAHRRYARMVNFREGWRGISGRDGLLFLLWMSVTCLPLPGISNKTPFEQDWLKKRKNIRGVPAGHI